MSKWRQHIVFDVEADGPCPGLYNMISFGLVSLADPARSFLGEVAPIVDNPGIAEARAVSGVSFAAQKAFRAPELVMAPASRNQNAPSSRTRGARSGTQKDKSGVARDDVACVSEDV